MHCMTVNNAVFRILHMAAVVLMLAGCSAAAPSSPASRGVASGPTAMPSSAVPSNDPAPAPGATQALPAGASPDRLLGAPNAVSAARAMFYDPAHGPTICWPSSGPRYSQAAGCPVTKRLEVRLQSNPTPNADPVCRCQNFGGPAVSTMNDDGHNALLLVDFSVARGGNVLNFLVVNSDGRWFVDDTNCGTAASSIYVTPVKTCAT